MRTIIFILVFIVTVFAACNDTAFSLCQKGLANCLTTVGLNKNEQCICFGHYIKCADTAGCANPIDVLIEQCNGAGCTTAQCNSATSFVFSLTLTAIAVFF